MKILGNGLFAVTSESTVGNPAILRVFEWLFFVFIAALPLMQLGLNLPSGTATIADLLFVAVLLVGVFAIAARATQLCTAPRHLLYLLLLGYIGLGLVSAAFGDWPLKSAARLLIEIYMVLLAVVSLNAVASVQTLRRIAIAWMIGTAATVVAALFGMVLFYSGFRAPWQSVVLGSYGSLPPGNYPRVHGLFLNMNMCCDYLIVSFVLLLLCRRLGWLGPATFWTLMVGIWITAAFTVSPCIGGMLLAAGIWLWQYRDRKPRIARASLLVGITGAFAFWLACTISPINSGSPAWRVPLLNRSLEPSSRLLCWGEGARIWLSHPLFGRGTGLEVPCPAYLDASGEIQHLLDAHNIYLNTLATRGLLGLLALIGIFGAVLWPVDQMDVLASREALEIYNALRVAVISAFLYTGLSGSFEHTRHLWVLLGLLAGARELAGRNTALMQDGQKPKARFESAGLRSTQLILG
jgi:O-antigen ligase